MKSNLESKKFYKEANDMQPGWGDTLRRIDLLKDRVESNQPISFKDALYIEWAEYRVSANNHYGKLEKMAKDRNIDTLELEPALWRGLIQGMMEYFTKV